MQLTFRAATARALSWMVLALALLLAANVSADEELEKTLEQQIAEWRAVVGGAQEALSNDFQDRSPASVMSELRSLQREAQSVRRSAQARLDDLKGTLEQLGRPPEEDEPEEPQPLRELRASLQQAVADQSARVRIAEVAESRSGEMLEQIAGWEQRRFRREQTQRMPRPTHADVWYQAGEDAMAFVSKLVGAPVAWWQERRASDESRSAIALFVVLPLLGVLLGWPLRRAVLQRFGRDPAEYSPSYARRIIGAIADGTANALVPVLIISLVVLVLYLQGLLTGLFAAMVYVVSVALAGFLVLFGMSRAALSPHHVAWRIVPVDPARVVVLLGAIRLAALVMAIGAAVLSLMLLTRSNTEELESIFLFIYTVMAATTAAWVLSPRYWITSVKESQEAGPVDQVSDHEAETKAEEDQEAQPPEQEDSSRPLLDVLRGLLRLVVLTAPVLALFGYSRLAYFIQSRLLATALVIGFGLLLHIAARELIQRFFLSQPARRYGSMIGGVQRPTEASLQGMVFWTSLVADVLIFVPLIYGPLLLYGVPPATLLLWTQNLFSGIEIGGFTLAPGNLLVAALILSAGLIATNLFRRWLTNRVLPNTRLEYGARNSIAAGSSYLGVGLALLMAMGALGLDFTNLALVVGALSLGIGFGLRNVVENFVAGLLLLIERPIKVGDWIIVGEHEGTVRHISVRSTEIETFDRASVIVPNADLISSSVINWTHKNRMARERIAVRAAHGSDTEKVAQILLRCAAEHQKVLRNPPPIALFVGFGESSLDLELRCFIGDTDDFMTVRSELHFAIERALREEGIVIPFPQRDVHLHQTASSEASKGTSKATGGEPPDEDPATDSGRQQPS
ncbi:MAG: mechanosensitive ion channel [Ectothiorhodospiraceae bacterium]|nr:mechanosensitive ion channel [Ectothiorhodospiraceae bacterium]